MVEARLKIKEMKAKIRQATAVTAATVDLGYADLPKHGY